MFGIGMQEILLIIVVALLVVGPNKLPDLARSLGKGVREFRKAADDVSDGIKGAMIEDDDAHKKTLGTTNITTSSEETAKKS